MRARRSRAACTWVIATFLAAACSGEPERNLSDLVLRDSTYFEAETLKPYSGDVFKYFPGESAKIQLRGHMRDGTWNGELVVYHPNGRTRYMGTLVDGAKCGVWSENQDPNPPKSLYKELKQEIESMGLYPPCPDS